MCISWVTDHAQKEAKLETSNLQIRETVPGRRLVPLEPHSLVHSLCSCLALNLSQFLRSSSNIWDTRSQERLPNVEHRICLHSVQFSRSVMSDSLRPHGLQHTRPPCPSPTPGVYLNSCALSRWCHPTISSSVVPFSSCLQSFPASGSFQVSQFFTSGGQSIRVSASASVLPMNTQNWFPLGWTGWVFLLSNSQESSPTPQFKSINSSALSFLYSPLCWPKKSFVFFHNL